jgi:drug/metabolite transporter (DMT)-like permease
MLDIAVVRPFQCSGKARSSSGVAGAHEPRTALPIATARLLAILALVGANIIWGTTFVVTKPLLDHVPPLTLASSRFAVALLVLLPVLARSGRRPVLNRTTAVMGFTGVFVVYVCQNLGLRFTGAADGALIHGGIPVFTAVFAVPALGERLGRGRVAGLTLSLVGVAAVVLLSHGSRIGLSALGDGLVFLSALGLAAYLVLGRRAFPTGSSLDLVAGVAVWGFIFLLPASAVELHFAGMGRPTVGDLLGILYLGGAASALAFVLWAHGLRHLEAGQAAIFANLNPLVGVAVAALFLGERVTPVQVGGGLLILTGVWLATRQQAGVTARPDTGTTPGTSPARPSMDRGMSDVANVAPSR